MTKENKQELVTILVKRIRNTDDAYRDYDVQALEVLARAVQALIALEAVEVK